MKLGIHLGLWSFDVLAEPLDHLYPDLVELGYEGVEVPVLSELRPVGYEKLGEKLEGLGLERVAVTGRGPNANPLSADPAVREKGRSENLAAIECADAMGAKLLVGPLAASPGVFTGAPATSAEWNQAVEDLSILAEAAAARGIVLGLEWLSRFETYLTTSSAEAVRLCRDVNHPSLALMYDTCPAHIEEPDVRNALLECRNDLVHVHLAENDRSTPGSGQVDWESTFLTLAEIGYDHWLSVEAFGQASAAAAVSTGIWRSNFSTPIVLAKEAAAFIRSQWQHAAATAPGQP